MTELRFGALVGTPVVDTDGDELGRVFEVHVEDRRGRLCISHLLVGRRGLAARLSLNVSWHLPGEAVPWERVVDVQGARIVVRPALREGKV